MLLRNSKYKAIFISILIFLSNHNISFSNELFGEPTFSYGINEKNFNHNIGISPGEYDWMFNACNFSYNDIKKSNEEAELPHIKIDNEKYASEFFEPFLLHCNRKIIPYLDVIRFKEISSYEFENSLIHLAHTCGYYDSKIYIRLLFSMFVLGEKNVKNSRNFLCGKYWQSSCYIAAIDSMFKYQAIPYSKTGSKEFYGEKFLPFEIEEEFDLFSEADLKRLGLDKQNLEFCNGVEGWQNG